MNRRNLFATFALAIAAIGAGITAAKPKPKADLEGWARVLMDSGWKFPYKYNLDAKTITEKFPVDSEHELRLKNHFELTQAVRQRQLNDGEMAFAEAYDENGFAIWRQYKNGVEIGQRPDTGKPWSVLFFPSKKFV